MRLKPLLTVSSAAILLALFAPMPSRGAQMTRCLDQSANLVEYPAHSLSPKASLKHYDKIFLGEVAVPTRPCSLGYCAGIKVIEQIKGKTPKTALLQVQQASDQQCLPSHFRKKGERWLVFAHEGTSKGGTAYLSSEDDGPSYLTKQAPDFNALEGRYMMMQARLDEAIDRAL